MRTTVLRKCSIAALGLVLGQMPVTRPGLALAASDEISVPGSEELIGVWAGRRDFGPVVRGDLIIERHGSDWFAEIAGYRSRIEHEGGRLSFEIPGDLGAFHGRVDGASDAIHGQWIQPGVIAMFGQRFSTPVALESVAPGRWRGVVSPLPDQVHAYFVLQSGEEGTVRAFLRNPEVNFGRFFEFSEVRRVEDSVELWGTLAWQSDTDQQVLLNGMYRREMDLLSVFIEDLGGTYDLVRLDAESMSNFYPRPWAEAPYRYHPPAAFEDGWETADLGGVGMAVEPIESLVRKMISTPIDAIDSPYVDAVLIARHGKLVLEEYFHGNSRGRAHDTRSASKSLTATLVGAAAHAGDVTLDTKIYEVMNNGVAPGDLDPRASRMTLEHLITMTSGLACDDWDSESPGGEDRMQNQSDQPDWNRYVLDLPMAFEPGEHPAYCSGGMSLAGAVVARAAGIPLTEYFDRYLARPLQMGVYHTNLMSIGEAYAGGGLRITARDFLKFGQLLLNDGKWNGRRILDQGWAEAALTERHDLGGERFGSYGYGWWLIDYESEGHEWQAFYAGGNGGNYIIGIPELDLVIVFMASNYNQSVQHETKYDYVPQYILKSAIMGEQ